MEIDTRTGLHHIDEEECWQLLAGQEVGRLAVSISNQPDVFPVNYVLDGRTIVVNTLPGLKLAAAAFGDGVAFEVDDLDTSTRSGWSVVVQGTAVEVTEWDELDRMEMLDVEPWADSPKYRFLRITPTKVRGRRLPRNRPSDQ